MSYSPKPLGFLSPTGCAWLPEFLSYHAYSPSTDSSPSKEYRPVVPARAAYSHSASESSRYCWPVSPESHLTYFWASSQLTVIAGCLPPPKECPTCGQPPYWTQASHWSNVSSNLETAKGRTMVTSCCGPSLSCRPFSVVGDPIMNLPKGTTTTISGQYLE